MDTINNKRILFSSAEEKPHRTRITIRIQRKRENCKYKCIFRQINEPVTKLLNT